MLLNFFAIFLESPEKKLEAVNSKSAKKATSNNNKMFNFLEKQNSLPYEDSKDLEGVPLAQKLEPTSAKSVISPSKENIENKTIIPEGKRSFGRAQTMNLSEVPSNNWVNNDIEKTPVGSPNNDGTRSIKREKNPSCFGKFMDPEIYSLQKKKENKEFSVGLYVLNLIIKYGESFEKSPGNSIIHSNIIFLIPLIN